MARSKHITAEEIYDNPLVNKLQEAAGDVWARYTPADERKNSIAAAIAQILQVLNIVAVTLGPSNPWVAIGVGIAILIGETAFHAFTKGPLTKSAVNDLKKVLAEQSVNEKLDSGDIIEVTEAELPDELHAERKSPGFTLFQ